MPRAIIPSRGRRNSALIGAIASVIGLSIAGCIVYGTVAQTKASIPPSAPANPGPKQDIVALASPGWIEGKSDLVEVGAAVDGLIQSIPVKEGQWVARGDVLAQLDCRDLQSILPVARAEAESFRQVRDRLLLGSRKEERAASAQRTAAAKAVLANASRKMERSRQLVESDTISKAAFDEARRDGNVAEADYQRVMRDEELVNAGPLSEDVAKANADLQAAEKRITLAQEKLGKCVVRAPIEGTILRILLRPGESFALVAPRPVLTMADVSGRRVRAEVDERDVGKVHLGQTVVVFSEAYVGQRFIGKVTKVAPVMGRKSVFTGDPADKHDRDILEVTAQLEPAATALPIGLRATVQFLREISGY